ncbi:unnamed protein product [Calicophoron daubneyi]|uniref:Uncharacterized protein n=1 Tax=Calicophoron daubneyi TaxID=300641 RepID=A0AAV2T9Y1_CALDB
MTDKPHITRENTMAVTAKIGKELLGKEKLGDTRQSTALKRSKKLKKMSTMAKTIEEAKAVLGSDAKFADVDSERTLRKRPAARSNQPDRKRRKASTPTGEKNSKNGDESDGDNGPNSV